VIYLLSAIVGWYTLAIIFVLLEMFEDRTALLAPYCPIHNPRGKIDIESTEPSLSYTST
jgi:hypothetical protein